MLFRGVIVGAASGRVGALVASHNRGGQYMRARVTPTNPNTVFQQGVRNAVRTLSNAWLETVSDVERAGWTAYAQNVTRVNRLGDTVYTSGFSWFVGNNIPRFNAGLPVIQAPPVIFNTGQPDFSAGVTLTIEGTAGTLTLGSSPSDLLTADADGALLLYVSRPIAMTRNFFKGPYRLAAVIPGNDTNLTFDFTSPFDRGSTLNQMIATISTTRGDGRLATGFQVTT